MRDRTSISPFFVRVRTSSGRSSWSSTGATAKGPKNVATRSHARRTVVSRNDFQPDPQLSDSHRLKVVWEPLTYHAYLRGRNHGQQLRYWKGNHGRARSEADH